MNIIKHTLLYLLILLAPAIAIAQGEEWERIPLPPNTDTKGIERIVRYAHLLVFPLSNGDLFASTGEHRLYRSTDAGRSWQRRGSGLFGTRVYSMSEGNDGELYAVTQAGFYRSLDRGNHWSAIYRTSGGQLLPLPDGALFAMTEERGPILLPKGAAAWRILDTVSTGRPGGRISRKQYAGAAVDSAGAIYILRPQERTSSILRTTDQGASWDSIPISTESMIPRMIQINTRGDLFVRVGDSIWRSTDQGAAWRKLPVMANSTDLPLIIASNDILYLGHQRSTDNGETWSHPYVGKRESELDKSIPGINIAVDRAGRVYAFSLDGTLYRSRAIRSVHYSAPRASGSALPFQRSLTWKRLTLPAWENTFGLASFAQPFQILFVGRNGALYAGGPRAGLYRSTNDGASWSEVWATTNRGFRETNRSEGRHMVSALYANGIIYAGISQEGIFRSRDDGATWEKVFAVKRPVLLSRGKDGVIWGSSSDTLVSTSDGGNSWNAIPLPDRGAWGMPAIDSTGVIYTAMVERMNHRIGMMRSTDGGISWSDISVPPAIGEPYLYAGPLGELYTTSMNRERNSDFLSTDQGASWGEMIPSGRLQLNRSMMLGPGRSLVVSAIAPGASDNRFLGIARISLDGGRTWRGAAQPFGYDEIAVAFAADTLDRLYIATNAGIIYRSEGSMLDSAAIDEVPLPVEGWRAPSFNTLELRKQLRYPASALRERRAGRVILIALVDARGKASKIEALGEDEALESVVLKGAERITFSPGLRDGVPMEGWVTATIYFGKEVVDRRDEEWDSTITVRLEGFGVGPWMKPGSVMHQLQAAKRELQSFATLDTEPRWDSLALHRNIRYPRAALLQRVEGEFEVVALIGPSGKVEDAFFDEEAGEEGGIDSAAIDAVRRTTFTPATYNGRNVAAWIHIPIHFVLPEPGENRSASIDTAKLRELLIYPPKELRKEIGSRVFMTVTIDTAGEIRTRYDLPKSPFYTLVEKALQRVEAKPGLVHGIPVEDSLTLDIGFDPGDRREKRKPAITIQTGSAWGGTGTMFDVAPVPMELMEEPIQIEPPKEKREEFPDKDEFIAVEVEPTYDPVVLGRNVTYPQIALRNGIEGDVVVRALIDKNGKVVRTTIVRSANAIFNDAAVEAVMKTTFTPATQGGKRIAFWVQIPIKFRLNR